MNINLDVDVVETEKSGKIRQRSTTTYVTLHFSGVGVIRLYRKVFHSICTFQ